MSRPNRVMPLHQPQHDLDAEAAVLSAVLIDGAKAAIIRDRLQPEHFFSEAHRQIWTAVVSLFDRGHQVDTVSVSSRLRETNRLSQVGGSSYLTQILNAAPAVSEKALVTYAAAVLDTWRAREQALLLRTKLAELEAGRVSPARANDDIRRGLDALTPITRASAAPAITTLGVEDIFAELPPIPWRIEALRLAPGAACAIAGYGFGGKTIAAQSIAVSCASGRPVFGVFRVERCRVLHLDYEQGRRLTFERYQRLARGMGVESRELEDRLRVSIMPAVYLDAASGADAYARAFDGFGIVMVDSLRAAAPSADENSSEIRRHIDVLTRAGEKSGALPIFLHHARKPTIDAPGGSKMSIRGSSAIFDACASVFVLDAEKGGPTRVIHEKERITGLPVSDFGLRVEDVEIAGDARAGLRVVHLESEQLAPAPAEAARAALLTRVRQALKEQPGLPGKEALCGVLGGNRSNVYRAIRELEERGEIREARDGRRRSLFLVENAQ